MNTNEIAEKISRNKKKEDEEVKELKEQKQFLVFSLDNTYYCLPSIIVSEVVLVDVIFKLPFLPSYIKGLVNRYSLPYTIINLNEFLTGKSLECKKNLVLKDDIDRISFMITDIIDMASVSESDIYQIDKSRDGESEMFDGYFEWENERIIILNDKKILERITKDITNINF